MIGSVGSAPVTLPLLGDLPIDGFDVVLTDSVIDTLRDSPEFRGIAVADDDVHFVRRQPTNFVSDDVQYAMPTITGTGGFPIMDQGKGRVTFDLFDGYSMFVDERDSSVFVSHADRSESIRVWGDGQLALDGLDFGYFVGTTSFVVRNGAKLTFETKARDDAADIYHLDKITVTKGDVATVVSGISQETGGNLAVWQSHAGNIIDENVRDGYFVEHDTLIGWANEYGVALTPEMLAATHPGGDFGPGSTRMTLDEFRTFLYRFYSLGQVGSLLSLTMRQGGLESSRHDSGDSARAAAVRRALVEYADEMAALNRTTPRHLLVNISSVSELGPDPSGGHSLF